MIPMIIIFRQSLSISEYPKLVTIPKRFKGECFHLLFYSNGAAHGTAHHLLARSKGARAENFVRKKCVTSKPVYGLI